MRHFHTSGFGASGVIFCAFFTFAAIACAGTYSGGSGTADDPYKISTVADWQELIATSTDWDKYFILVNDIDFGGILLGPVGKNDATGFTGLFDGNNRILRDVHTQSYDEYIGLFGYLKGGCIQNLDLDDVSSKGGTAARTTGGMVGINVRGQIINCSIKGSVTGSNSFIGGMVGSNQLGDIIDCYSYCEVVGGGSSRSVGGLVGSNSGGRLLNCFAQSDVYTSIFAEGCGGLVGWNGSGGTIRDCYANGTVNGHIAVGGLVGGNSGGTIADCHATGLIAGDSSVGGLVGINSDDGIILHCYAESTVDGDYGDAKGGLAGINDDGFINDSYATGMVKGNQFIGGLVGVNQIGHVARCFAAGSTFGNTGIGGAFGHNWGTVSDCYATGEVHGKENVGGLCGLNDFVGSMITSCYSTGYVFGSGSTIGGLIGFNTPEAIVTACYWNISTSGRAVSAGGLGKTTIEMMNPQTYIGWGPVWTIRNGQDYPRLAWENTGGDPFRLFSGGSGTETDHYQISTSSDWVDLINYPATWICHFTLTQDLDLKEITLAPIASNPALSIPLQGVPFSGTFNGENHTIRNVVMNYDGKNAIGLFGYLRDCLIRDLRVEVIVTGNQYVGGLAGYNDNGGLMNCHVSGTVNGNKLGIGGLVGYSDGGFIRDCSTTGYVNGNTHIGGLIGRNISIVAGCFSSSIVRGGSIVGGLFGTNNSDDIIACYAMGSVFGDYMAGGFVGEHYSDVITNCYSIGDVTGNSTSNYIGGFVGYSESSGAILSCYAKGAVKGRYSVGGFMGSGPASIYSCYSVGSVSSYPNSRYIGGFVGQKEYGAKFSSCFWNINSSGITTSAGGVGKTTAEMKALSTFTSAGWDFVGEAANGTGDVWRMCGDGIDYPRLSWEFSRGGDMDCPDGVGMEDLVYLAGRWMASTPATFGAADTNADGRVDLLDLAILSENWGRE
jgi:hypothetical protein